MSHLVVFFRVSKDAKHFSDNIKLTVAVRLPKLNHLFWLIRVKSNSRESSPPLSSLQIQVLSQREFLKTFQTYRR